MYNSYGGVVLAAEEGERIAEALGSGKGAILRNHGLLTVGHTVDEAAFLFLSMEHACQGQILAESAAANGLKKVLIEDEEAAYNFKMESDYEVSVFFIVVLNAALFVIKANLFAPDVLLRVPSLLRLRRSHAERCFQELMQR